MKHSFRNTVLITWLVLLISCQPNVVKTGFDTENISVSAEASGLDSSIIQLYQPYKIQLDKDMQRVISHSEQEMQKDKPESLLTNFLADLLLDEAIRESEKQGLEIHPDVSFFNYGGIRTSLPKGDITVGKIFELMPFENQMVFVKLKGEKMKAFLDYVAGNGGDSVGGARFTIVDDKAVNITIGGSVFDPEKSYWLVTNDYVAAGGDGLSMLQNSEQFVNSDTKIRDLIIQYMERQHENEANIVAKLDGRISYE